METRVFDVVPWAKAPAFTPRPAATHVRQPGPLLGGRLMMAIAACLAVPGASAQEQPLPPAVEAPAAEVPAPATVTLNIEALLTESLVSGDGLNDPLWTLEPLPGRSSLLLPLHVVPGEGDTELSEPAVTLAGARFVGWHIPDAQANDAPVRGNAGRRDLDQPQPRFVAGNHRYARFLGDPNTDPTRGTLNNEPVPAQDASVDGPRLARSITVAPSGTVSWELDRNIPGATLDTGDNLYALKLSPQRMREQAPERGERIRRNQGEDAREFAQRQQAARAEERAAQEAYRATRDAVSDLPVAFSARPQIVWAVYEQPDNRREVTIEGPAPLPWTMPAESFEAIRAVAGRSGGSGGIAEALPGLEAAVQTGHPLSLQAVAVALAGSDALGQAGTGDATMRLAESVLRSGDGEAIRIVVDSLAGISQPTPATNRLLGVASQTDDPLAKLAALQATLRGQVDNPAAVARVVQQADAVLTDPNGPPPAMVLSGLADTTERSPTAKQALMVGVRFEGMPPDRRREAIDFIATHAQDPEGLPAAWLDTKLLGSNDPALVRETLERLTAGSSGPSQVTPLVQSLRSAVFGGPTENPANAHTANPNRDLPAVENLALASGGHGLFRALQSGDPETQALAWQALGAFTVTERRGRGNPDGSDPLDMILEAATSQPVVPPSLVTFLERQTDGPRTTAALMRLAAEGDGRLAGRAVDVLLKPTQDQRGQSVTRSYDQALRDLTPDQHVGFVQAVYTHAGGGSTPVANLAADDRAMQWFARQLREGVIPPPGAWVEPLGGETRALDTAGSEDDGLAHGALAALAAAAGADTTGQLALIDRLGQAPRSADDIQTKWAEAKRAIQTAQLADAAGDHRLVVEVIEGTPTLGRPTPDAFADPAMGMGMGMGMGGPADFGAPVAPVAANDPGMRPRRIVLGVVELVVDQTTVKLVGDPVTLTIPEDRLALRIEDPEQLRNFPNDDIEEVPLANVTPPLDLVRNEQGAWQGEAAFGETHTLRVTLEPVR